jgi:hypothetical protein
MRYFVTISKRNTMKKLSYLVIIMLSLAGISSAQRPINGNIRQVTATVPVVILSAPTTSVEPGTDFTVPITVSDTTGLGIIAYQFELHYDSTVIMPRANAVEVAGTLSSQLTAVYNPNMPGILRVAVYGAYPLSGAGNLINIKFTAVGAAGSVSPLTWVNCMFNEGNPGVGAANGLVGIVAPAGEMTFSGRETSNREVDYQNNVYRENTLAMVADDQAKESSMVVSFDFVPTEGRNRRNCFTSIHGEWTLMVYERGVYVGSIYGDVYEGVACDQIDSSIGTAVQRTIRAIFRIHGGIGRYENITPEPMGEHEYTSTTTYTNVKSVKAVLNDMP